MLRSVTARELTFWQAYEEIEGPIGYGPLVKLAAWLGSTQYDSKKVSSTDVLEMVEKFLADPHDENDDEASDESDDPQTEEEAQAARRAEVEAKLMAIFNHPELRDKANQHDDR